MKCAFYVLNTVYILWLAINMAIRWQSVIFNGWGWCREFWKCYWSVYICCIQMLLLKFSINDVNNRNLHLHQHNRMQSLNNSIQLIWHPLIAKYIEITLESQQIIKILKQFKKRNGDKKKYLQWNFIKASNEVDMGGQIEKKYSINVRLVHSQYGVDTRVWIHML